MSRKLCVHYPNNDIVKEQCHENLMAFYNLRPINHPNGSRTGFKCLQSCVIKLGCFNMASSLYVNIIYIAIHSSYDVVD